MFEVTRIAHSWVQRQVTDGVALRIGRHDQVLEDHCFGQVPLTPEGRASCTAGMTFDLASLTKILITAPLTLMLIDNGALALDTRAGSIITSLSEVPAGSATIEQLLTHTSGLPPTISLPLRATPADVIQALSAISELAREQVVYSDVGFLLLQLIIERTVDRKLADVAAQHLLRPLGMADTGFTPTTPSAATADFVGNDIPRVHDPAAAALGGAAGHAGLFSTAVDVGLFAAAWATLRIPGLGSASIEAANLNHVSGHGGFRSFGWALRGDPYDCTAGSWPSTTLSHTGFTGTSVALDPVSGWWVVLLTNAVRRGTALQPHRRQLHAAIARTRFPSARDV